MQACRHARCTGGGSTTEKGVVARARTYLERNRVFIELLGSVVIALAIGVPTTLLYLQSNALLEREVLVAEADVVPRPEVSVAQVDDISAAEAATASGFGWLIIRNRGGPAYDVQVGFDDCVDVCLSSACSDRGPWYRVFIPCIYYSQYATRSVGSDVLAIAAPPHFVQEQVYGGNIYAWENDATGRLENGSCVSMYTRIRSLVTVKYSDRLGRQYERRYVVESNLSGDAYETQETDIARAIRPYFSQKTTTVAISELQAALDRVATSRNSTNCTCDVFSLTGGQFRKLISEFVDTAKLEEGFRG